jgi:hypothetical protein
LIWFSYVSLTKQQNHNDDEENEPDPASANNDGAAKNGREE